MVVRRNAGTTHRWPAVARVLGAAGMKSVRITADYEAWATDDDATLRVLVYNDGHWVIWDERAGRESSTGLSSAHLRAVLGRYLKEEGVR